MPKQRTRIHGIITFPTARVASEMLASMNTLWEDPLEFNESTCEGAQLFVHMEFVGENDLAERMADHFVRHGATQPEVLTVANESGSRKIVPLPNENQENARLAYTEYGGRALLQNPRVSSGSCAWPPESFERETDASDLSPHLPSAQVTIRTFPGVTP